MFTQSNNDFYHLTSGIRTRKNLDGGIYNLLVDGNGNRFLRKSEETFALPKKTYGSTNSRTSRIMNSYRSRVGKNTGIALIGTKGSGKSLQAKDIGINILNEENEYGKGIVIIIPNGEYVNQDFIAYLQDIKQPCNIFLDEFEKTFDDKEQEMMLTVMDGGLVKDKLFTITVNNVWKVDQHMINRPGRVFYNITYKGLEKSFIQEYCDDVLVRKEYIMNIIRTSGIIEDFNFDMLQSIVEELNRYPDLDYNEVISIMNVTPSIGSRSRKTKFEYNIISIDGENVSGLYTSDKATSPFMEDDYISFNKINRNTSTEEEEDQEDDNFKDYYSMNTQDLVIDFISDDGEEIHLVHDNNLKIVAKMIAKKVESKTFINF